MEQDRYGKKEGTPLDGGWFLLVRDDDGHSYVIPESHKDEWETWVDSQEWDDLPELPLACQIS